MNNQAQRKLTLDELQGISGGTIPTGPTTIGIRFWVWLLG